MGPPTAALRLNAQDADAGVDWARFGHRRKWLPYLVDTKARYLVRRGDLNPTRLLPLAPQQSGLPFRLVPVVSVEQFARGLVSPDCPIFPDHRNRPYQFWASAIAVAAIPPAP